MTTTNGHNTLFTAFGDSPAHSEEMMDYMSGVLHDNEYDADNNTTSTKPPLSRKDGA